MFFHINNSDPYKAISWDWLHAYGIGLLGDHIWEEILRLVKLLEHRDIAAVSAMSFMSLYGAYAS